MRQPCASGGPRADGACQRRDYRSGNLLQRLRDAAWFIGPEQAADLLFFARKDHIRDRGRRPLVCQNSGLTPPGLDTMHRALALAICGRCRGSPDIHFSSVKSPCDSVKSPCGPVRSVMNISFTVRPSLAGVSPKPAPNSTEMGSPL
jgi:hypothetical protein